MSHFDNVVRAITAEMVTAGIPGVTASTLAALAAGRIMAGDKPGEVIRELVDRHKPAPAEPINPEPPSDEPLHVRLAREAGKAPAARKTAEDRIAAALAAGNPWHQSSLNVTAQALVRGLDPARAAILEREAQR